MIDFIIVGCICALIGLVIGFNQGSEWALCNFFNHLYKEDPRVARLTLNTLKVINLRRKINAHNKRHHDSTLPKP